MSTEPTQPDFARLYRQAFEEYGARALGYVLHPADLAMNDEEQVAVETCVQATTARQGQYKAAIQVSQVGPYRYIDKSWHLR